MRTTLTSEEKKAAFLFFWSLWKFAGSTTLKTPQELLIALKEVKRLHLNIRLDFISLSHSLLQEIIFKTIPLILGQLEFNAIFAV